ncbi:MAG: AI-2E family transporter [Gammaproteobacteria bacterium]
MTHQTDFLDFRLIKRALNRMLPNSQAVGLLLIILVSFILIMTLSDLLMPVFASVVLAYLLDGLVVKAVRWKIPRLPAVYLVFFGFMASLGFLIFVLLPMLSEQAVELVQHIPEIVKRAQKEIMRLPEMYPQFISESRIREIMLAVQRELLTYGQAALTFSAASVVGLVTALVYLFLVPMMVFFFLKDKEDITQWLVQFLPRERHLTQSVWREVDVQIGNYVRGKFAEVVILMSVSYVTYSAMGLNYSILLAVLMGLSVIIPYVGATLVTFPVLGIAYFQWGFRSDDFMYVVIVYSIIQALDGVVLVPLLFSEAVNLHPIAIIVAILFFGGLWGFWGVFFAIPLATVVKAVLSAWPRIGESGLDTVY